MGDSKRGSEKLDLAAWRHGFDWANGHFVHVLEEAGTGIARLEMVGSIVAIVVHHYVLVELVHCDHSADSRG
jgi:hypothetical protein